MTLSLDPTTTSRDAAWQTAVAAAFEDHHRRIVGTIVRSSHDLDLAEDIAAEAFARLARAAADGRAPDDPAAWLHRVAHNLLVSSARRARVARTAAPRLVDRSTPEGPEEAALWHDETDRLAAAIGGLTPVQRVVLELAAAGWSSAEIGRRLGRSEVGVRTILCRARRRLRARVADLAAA